MTGSRPFLNLLNPLSGGRAYRGYEQARDDVVEEQDEDEEDEDRDDEDDRGEGPSSRPGWMRASTRPDSASRIRMQGATSPRHNSGTADDDEDDDDDGEVPQSFMIEARRGGSSGRTPKSPPQARHSTRTGGFLAGIKQPISMPPRPSDLQSGQDFTLPHPNTTPMGSAPSKQGLDEYERALWKWVNVYNLDAFLQEVRCLVIPAWLLCN